MGLGADKIAERRMRKALAEGKLSGLAGEGKPLPDRPEAAFVDAGTAVGFRLMAEAGVIPEEIAIRKQVAAQAAHLATLTDPAARKAAMAELARLQLRQAIAEEARANFMR